MAIERVVVEVELGVERYHAPVDGNDQRVDLGERAVLREVAREEILDQRGAGPELVSREAESDGEAPRLKRLKTERRVGPLSRDFLGRARGEFFDLHPARPARHHDVRGPSPVEGRREVQLGRDRRRLLDQDAAHLDAVGRRLGRPELLAEDFPRGHFRRRGIIRELDASRLAPPARVDLGLHDDATAEVLGDRSDLG